MNPLLAAIALHRAAQTFVRYGMLDASLSAYSLRDRMLDQARAIRNLERLSNV